MFAEQQLIRDQKPVLSRADVEGIINNQTTSLTDDVAKLKGWVYLNFYIAILATFHLVKLLSNIFATQTPSTSKLHENF